jgi:hypothetical protein
MNNAAGDHRHHHPHNSNTSNNINNNSSNINLGSSSTLSHQDHHYMNKYNIFNINPRINAELSQAPNVPPSNNNTIDQSSAGGGGGSSVLGLDIHNHSIEEESDHNNNSNNNNSLLSLSFMKSWLRSQNPCTPVGGAAPADANSNTNFSNTGANNRSSGSNSNNAASNYNSVQLLNMNAKYPGAAGLSSSFHHGFMVNSAAADAADHHAPNNGGGAATDSGNSAMQLEISNNNSNNTAMYHISQSLSLSMTPSSPANSLTMVNSGNNPLASNTNLISSNSNMQNASDHRHYNQQQQQQLHHHRQLLMSNANSINVDNIIGSRSDHHVMNMNAVNAGHSAGIVQLLSNAIVPANEIMATDIHSSSMQRISGSSPDQNNCTANTSNTTANTSNVSNNNNAIVPIDQSGAAAASSAARKSIDTFGQRTSIYRGVTKYIIDISDYKFMLINESCLIGIILRIILCRILMCFL